MKRIVVTGASGFVGRRLLAALGECGYPARGLVRAAHAGSGEFIGVDYGDAAALAAALRTADCVVHVAGLAHVEPRHLPDAEAAFHEANVGVACNVATACIHARVPRLVLLSSAGVLGTESPPGGFTVLSPARPHDPYTRSKLAAEQAVAEIAARAGIGLTILRPPMIYGPGAPGSYARLARLLDRRWPLPIGAIGSRRSLVGIYNLCEAIIAAIESAPSGTTALLVADEPPVTVAEFARQLAAARAVGARLPAVPVVVLKSVLAILGRRADYRRLFGAFELRTDAAREALGWVPRFTLAEQLVRTVGEEGGAAPVSGAAGIRGPSR